MYMPTLARFTARDPLPPEGVPVLLGATPKSVRQNDSREHTYAYARNSPITFVDPSGQISMKYIGPVPRGLAAPPNLSARYEMDGFTPKQMYKQYGNHRIYFECIAPCRPRGQEFNYRAFTIDLIQVAPGSRPTDDHELPIQRMCDIGPARSPCCQAGTWGAGSAGDMLEGDNFYELAGGRVVFAIKATDVSFRKTPCGGGSFADLVTPIVETPRLVAFLAGAAITFKTVLSVYDEADGTFTVQGGRCELTTTTPFSYPDYNVGPGGSGFP